MATAKKSKEKHPPVSVTEAIYQRRAVRDYSPHKVDKHTINTLLKAAVHAPTAMYEEPWCFAVVQDAQLLDNLSNSIKALMYKEAHHFPKLQMQQLQEVVKNPDFHVFYNAHTLIVVCSRFQGPFVGADCWLAAQNLMLAAYGEGLGTCPIGMAVAILNTPEWKSKLQIPSDVTAYAPIIVGYPAGETEAVPRKDPLVLSWK